MAYKFREQTEDVIECIQLIELPTEINLIESLLVFLRSTDIFLNVEYVLAN